MFNSITVVVYLIYFHFAHAIETNPLVEDADNSKVDYAFDNPAFKGMLYSKCVWINLFYGFGEFGKYLFAAFRFIQGTTVRMHRLLIINGKHPTNEKLSMIHMQMHRLFHGWCLCADPISLVWALKSVVDLKMESLWKKLCHKDQPPILYIEV